MVKQQVPRNRPEATNITDHLRRNILESALKGQTEARAAQEELERQGHLLRGSLAKAEIVAKQTDTTAQAVDDLISETKASRFRKLFRCCLDTCCCCCRCCCTGSMGEGLRNGKANSKLPAQVLSPIAGSDKEDCDSQALVILDSLKSDMTADGRQTDSWKKTLAPQPGDAALNSGTTEIWYRQVDASLTQLQQVAEDMGQSLDEQIRLAQMLTIYLNYGVDQVIGANERLGKAQ